MAMRGVLPNHSLKKVDPVVLRQFRFSAGPHGMEQPGPGLQAGAHFTSHSNWVRRLQFRQPLGVLSLCAILAIDNVIRTLGGQFKGIGQDRP